MYGLGQHWIAIAILVLFVGRVCHQPGCDGSRCIPQHVRRRVVVRNTLIDKSHRVGPRSESPSSGSELISWSAIPHCEACDPQRQVPGRLIHRHFSASVWRLAAIPPSRKRLLSMVCLPLSWLSKLSPGMVWVGSTPAPLQTRQVIYCSYPGLSPLLPHRRGPAMHNLATQKIERDAVLVLTPLVFA